MAFTGEGGSEGLERYRVLGVKISAYGTMLILQPLRAMGAMKKRTRFMQ